MPRTRRGILLNGGVRDGCSYKTSADSVLVKLGKLQHDAGFGQFSNCRVGIFREEFLVDVASEVRLLRVEKLVVPFLALTKHVAQEGLKQHLLVICFILCNSLVEKLKYFLDGHERWIRHLYLTFVQD